MEKRTEAPVSTLCGNTKKFSIFSFLISLSLLSGCGAPGDPRPPRPTVPVAITDLAARQVGAHVVLTFSLPERSTEGQALAAAPDIEIYRGFAAGAAAATEPNQLALTIPSALVETYTTENQIRFADPVKVEDLTAHKGDQWVYVVRTRVSGSSGPRSASAASNVATARVLPAPASPAGLAATVTENAVELRWQPVAEAISYRVFRAEAEAGTAGASQGKLLPPALLGASPVPAYRDEQIEFGRRYAYTVRAVSQIEAESVESEPSAAANVQPEDSFPPSAPANVVAIAVPRTAGAPAAMELSWSFSPETDVAGYHVYRSEKEGTPGQRITRELLFAPSFRDTSVAPGPRYTYWVTAVDRKGNESPRSAPVSETVPQP